MNGRIADVLPLTPVQEGLLFHAVRDSDGPDPYLVQARFRIGSAISPETVRAALGALMERHPNLRACFRHERLDRPVQVIPHAVTVPWSEADLTGRTPVEVESATADLLAADRTRRFDLARPPALRALFVRHDTGGELVLSFHHILLDGWSVPVLERDLAALVTGRTLPPAVPYRQYALWLSRQDQGRAEAAWREALAGLERPAPLVPPVRPAAPVPPGDDAGDDSSDPSYDSSSDEPDTVRLHLTAELTAALARRAAAEGVTLNTLTQAAWSLVLARMTGGRDLVFGGVVSGRPHDLPGVGEMVGLFINTLPVRVRLRDGETVGELLTRIQDEQWSLAPYHHVRLMDVQRMVGQGHVPGPGRGHGPGSGELFDSVLAFENFPRGAAQDPRDDGPHTVRVTDVRDATHYPVTLAVVAGERMLLAVGCRRGISAAAVAARVARAFEQLAGDPATPVDRIDVLPEQEHRELLARSAGTRTAQTAPSAGPVTMTGRFAEQAARTPDAPAVESTDGDNILTYARLAEESDRLARRLTAAGVTPGSTVALFLRRSPTLVVAQLAVLKAGACWLPLDGTQPAERLARLLDGASARLVLTEGEPSVRLPAHVRQLHVHGDSPEAGQLTASPHPESAACVMYTSGSSGEPKGVVVPQRAVVELAADTRFRPGGRGEPGSAHTHSRVLLHSPHTFDAATYEVWVPLLNGGTVVICPDEPVTPALLAKVLPERRVTALWLTAELFRTVAELEPRSLRGLREVWTGGDIVDPEAVRRVREHCPGTAVVNGYGPTETTVFATTHHVPAAGVLVPDIPAPSALTPSAPVPGALTPSAPVPDALTPSAPVPGAPVPDVPVPGVPADGAPAHRATAHHVPAEGILADGVPGQRVPAIGALAPGAPADQATTPRVTTLHTRAPRFPHPAPISGPLPIGRPLDGTRVHVLDARLRPVPDGCVGEVYIAGTGLAHGYLALPAATAERFVADPHGAPGTRMYRTGDLARRTPDGILEFAGRADDQLKIRGFRVEPAEVETALMTCPGVTRAVVAARPAPGGGKRLVAWVVLKQEGPSAPGMETTPLEDIRSAAAHRLPPHLLPTAWARIDAVPLTPHGKTDRSALPEPRALAPAGAAASQRAPRSAREKELCVLFGEVLGGAEAAGPDTDFFASGGHSLSALRLAGRIEEAWGVRVPVATLFAAPTPARLLARLDGPEPGTPKPGRPEPAHADSLAPLLTLRADADADADADDRAPLFCVHPGLGLSWGYVTLLPHLAPDRPVYALQTPALSEEGHRSPPTMGDLAQSYVDRIRTVRPHGPYLLLGTSFGGPVAHEMAVRLRAAGDEVALLAVVDAMPKPPEVARTPLAPAVATEEARRILRDEGAALDGIGEHRLAALAETIAHHVVLGRSWTPSRYDGTVTLFAATRDPEAIPTKQKAEAWRRAATAVEVHELACAHAEVLGAEPAARIAAALENILAGGPRAPLQLQGE
ncbi:non-ribosomal peptide synthetase [Streptomyces sp. NPDC003032]